MKTKLYSMVIIICILQYSCNGEKNNHQGKQISKNPMLFEVLGPDRSGINFVNLIKETPIMNGIFYEYLYNGGGIGVGDFNGDDLPDIYFTANLTSNKLFINKGELRFEDVTSVAGMKGEYGFHTGVSVVDINADGKMDIYICKSGKFDDPDKKRNELYVNQGNNEIGIPKFAEESETYGLDLPHQSTQAAFFDYDKDGDLDMFLLNHNMDPKEVENNIDRLLSSKSDQTSDRLYRNDHGKFIDVSEEAGMINNGIGFGLGVSIGDMNNDTWPDILVTHDFSEKDRLYLNQKDGSFNEVLNQATNHTSIFSMGSDIADINNDSWLDFITVDMVSENNYDSKTSMSGMNPQRFYSAVDKGLHYQYMYNTLQINQGADNSSVPRFSDIAAFAGVSNTDWSWAPLFFDMNNDGMKDLFISNGIKRDFRNVDYVIYGDKQMAKFENEHQEMLPDEYETASRKHIAEIVSKMPQRKKDNYFFRNENGLTFSNQNGKWAPVLLTCTNSAAYADLDQDGDLDLITNNMDDFGFIYKNNAVEYELGNYLIVRLSGSERNPRGIGARVSINSGGLQQTVENYSTRGFQSSMDDVIHFGLGNHELIDKLEVTWPDGKREVKRNVRPNQAITVSYLNAMKESKELKLNPLFEKLEIATLQEAKHTENLFDDFKRENLLPHKMSQEGPALAVGDVNGDGLEDFYLGGASGYSGQLFLQQHDQSFKPTDHNLLEKDKKHEDVGAHFFDADGDGDQDLYIVSGSNEFDAESQYLQDRLYVNDGKGEFYRAVEALPRSATSGSVVRSADYDNDGDLDLFIGGRQIPGKYPFPASSYILRNDSQSGNPLFTDITDQSAKMLHEIGLVTDAAWTDIDGDNLIDLVIVGEWMPITVLRNDGSGFINYTKEAGLSNEIGWWFSIACGDFDKDGDQDLVVGNLGLNSKYKASHSEPFEIYTKDFDGTGSLDIVLGFYEGGKLFPLRGRECTSNQMPFVKKKFPTYHSYAMAELRDIYSQNDLESALHYTATNFATTYFENKGDGLFMAKKLPDGAQLTTVKHVLPIDINNDGHLDVILNGNLYGFEVETPRQDAGYGLVLIGDGQGDFKVLPPYESGLYVKGEVADCDLIQIGHRKALIIAKNNDYIELFVFWETGNKNFQEVIKD